MSNPSNTGNPPNNFVFEVPENFNLNDGSCVFIVTENFLSNYANTTRELTRDFPYHSGDAPPTYDTCQTSVINFEYPFRLGSECPFKFGSESSVGSGSEQPSESISERSFGSGSEQSSEISIHQLTPPVQAVPQLESPVYELDNQQPSAPPRSPDSELSTSNVNQQSTAPVQVSSSVDRFDVLGCWFFGIAIIALIITVVDLLFGWSFSPVWIFIILFIILLSCCICCILVIESKTATTVQHLF